MPPPGFNPPNKYWFTKSWRKLDRERLFRLFYYWDAQESVLTRISTPPSDPSEGDRYLITAGAGGEWAGHEDDIAHFDNKRYVYTTPTPGMRTYIEDLKELWLFDNGIWSFWIATPNGGYIPMEQKGAVNGVAELNASGKIPDTQIPALAITDVYVVADIAARNALSPQKGDMAIVLDSAGDPVDGSPGKKQTYVWDGTAWKAVKETSDVISVAGKTGIVNLLAGDMSNITESAGELFYTDTTRANKKLSIGFSSVIIGARDLPAANAAYFRGEDGLAMNMNGVRLRNDATLVGIIAQGAYGVSQSWTAEVRKNGALTVVDSLAVAAADYVVDNTKDTDFSANDDIQPYMNGSAIDRPKIILFFRRRLP